MEHIAIVGAGLVGNLLAIYLARYGYRVTIFEGKISDATISSPTALQRLCADHFPDVLPLLAPVLATAFDNPFESMVTIKCFPWVYHDRIALIGDACHAILPFYGRGANAGSFY
jgi:kynurenine 3-monooxygenase